MTRMSRDVAADHQRDTGEDRERATNVIQGVPRPDVILPCSGRTGRVWHDSRQGVVARHVEHAVMMIEAIPAAAPTSKKSRPLLLLFLSAYPPTMAQPSAEPSSGTSSRLRGAKWLMACIEAIAFGAESDRSAGVTKVEKLNNTPPQIMLSAAVGWMIERTTLFMAVPRGSVRLIIVTV